MHSSITGKIEDKNFISDYSGVNMELYAFLLTVVLVSLSGVMAPGPLFAAAIAEGRKNVFSGFIISAGHAAVEVPLILALFLFGMSIATESIKVMAGILGGIVLLYLAFIEYKNFGKEIKAKKGRSFFTGVVMSSFNPYFLMWWFVVGFYLISQSIVFGIYGLLLFIVVHELCDFLWLGFVSATSNRTAYLWGKKAYKTLSIISISIFVTFGAYFFITGVNSLLNGNF